MACRLLLSVAEALRIVRLAGRAPSASDHGLPVRSFGSATYICGLRTRPLWISNQAEPFQAASVHLPSVVGATKAGRRSSSPLRTGASVMGRIVRCSMLPSLFMRCFAPVATATRTAGPGLAVQRASDRSAARRSARAPRRASKLVQRLARLLPEAQQLRIVHAAPLAGRRR